MTTASDNARADLEAKGYVEVSPGKWKQPVNAIQITPQVIKPVKRKVVAQATKPTHDDAFDSQLERDLDLVLRVWKRTGKIHDYLYSPFKLCLGYKVFYKIDFLVIYEFEEGVYRFDVIEVKGKKAWDDAIVKIKNAANLMPYMDFYLTTRNDLGQWCHNHVPPAGHKSWKQPGFNNA